MLRVVHQLSHTSPLAAVCWLALCLAPATLPASAKTSNLSAKTVQHHRLPDRIASRARQVATQMDTVGWCFAGVKQALQAVGVSLEGAAAWMAADQLKEDYRFKMVTQKDLRRGDILVHEQSPTHPYGHIAVYLGSGTEASDHVQHLIVGGTYGKTVVFRARGGGSGGTSDSLANSPSRRRVVNAGTVTAAAPRTPVVQPPDPQVVAAARTQAAKFVYLYNQGAVSRKDAQARLAHLKELESQSGSTAVAGNQHHTPDA